MSEMRTMSMPKMLYGTAWKKDRTTDLVIQAVNAGFRGIDTACQPKHYREDLVGKAISVLTSTGFVKREELFIQTKFTSIDGQDTNQPLPYDPKSSITDQVNQSFQRSLQNLGVEYIDSVVLHSPLRSREKTLEAYRALEGHAAQGKVHNLGVSNIYDAAELEWLIGQAREPVKVVQNRWYQGNGWDWDVYDLCQKHDIRYQYVSTSLHPSPEHTGMAHYDRSFWTLTGSPSLLQHSALISLGEKHGLTPEQTLYKLCQLYASCDVCRAYPSTEEGVLTKDQMEYHTSVRLYYPGSCQEALAVEENTSLTVDEPEVQGLWGAMRRTSTAAGGQ